MEFVAQRNKQACVRVSIEGDRVGDVVPVPWDESGLEDDLWVFPAFIDLQMNGRWGISFASPDLTIEQVAEIVLAQAGLGTARVYPTLITSHQKILRHAVKTIARACDRWPEIDRMVAGIHLEGPCISEVDGYRGAHPLEAVRDPDINEFTDLDRASGQRIRIVTLAPERAGAIGFIRYLRSAGVVVALGHTAADGATISAAVDAGARLSTHLGNGIASPLARHPNPIWQQAANDTLYASLIADGHHLDRDTLRVLRRAKGTDRTILVSDASPLAGLPVGDYGPWSVAAEGKIVVTGTTYLAGSNQGLAEGISNLLEMSMESLEEAILTVTANPARLMGQTRPEVAAGASANLVILNYDYGLNSVAVERTCVDGRWFAPAAANSSRGAVSGAV
jgi:N-acetylglucosamine-6-phosphate deacetylase